MTERTIERLRQEVGAAFIGRKEVDDWQEKWRLDVEFLLAEVDRLREEVRQLEGKEASEEERLAAWVRAQERSAREEGEVDDDR